MAPVTANHRGAYFFREYYKAFLYDRHRVHHFYSDNSNMIHVDGISSKIASNKLQIEALLKSLNIVAVEIKTINSVYSLDGGVFSMASGLVKIKDLSERRKFVQGVFLAPQENGYYVLSDIFQFTDDEVTNPIEGSLAPGKNKNNTQQPQASATPTEQPALDNIKSTHVEDDPVDKHSVPEQQQQQKVQQDPETGTVGQPDTNSAENASSSVPSVDANHERLEALVEELLEEEPPQRTYASVLRSPRPPNSQLNRVARRASR